ncbi:MAG: DUF885 family protein, partial [Candidatus Binatia bacterium]
MNQFDDFCDSFFQKYFALHPTDAIYYGIDGYDHLLTDYSDDTYAEEKAFWKDSLQQIRQVSVKGLTKDETIDYALLEGRLTIENYEFNKEDYRLKQPETYLPVPHIYILTVRPTKDRLGNILSRLELFPEVINQGIANLSRSEANPPGLWTENAVEAAKGGLDFLDTLPGNPSVASVLTDPTRLKEAIEKAKG